MDRYRKLGRNTGLFAVGTFGSKLLVFLLMPLYTAFLSPAEYGTAELISGTASLLMPLACVGVTNGIFRFVAEKETDFSKKQEIFSSGVALLTGGLLFFLAVGIPLSVFGSRKLEITLVLLYVLFADLQAVFSQYVRAMDRTKLFAVQGIFNTLCTISLNILFLTVFHLGMAGYILSVILGNLFTSVFLFFRAKLWKSLSPFKVRKKTVLSLAKFSLPLVPASVCWLVTALSDRFLVTFFCGEAANGIYSAAYKIPTIVNLSAGVFLQAWQFSAVSEAGNREECGKFYEEVFRCFLSVIFLGSGGLILFSPILSRLLLNRAYWEAEFYMPTLLSAAALEAIVSFLASVYLVRKKSVNSFFTAIAGAILNVVLNVWLIPLYGPMGAAVATLGGYGLVYLLRIRDVPKYLPFFTSPVRQVFGVSLLLAEAWVMTYAGKQRFFFAVPIFLALIAVFLPPLLEKVRIFLQKKKSF